MISSDILTIPAQGQSVLGKTVSEMISADTKVLSDGSVAGTLHHVKGYSQFSDTPEEQDGHYFPVMFADSYKGKPITVKGRSGGDRTVILDEDRLMVLRREGLSGSVAEIESESKPVVSLDFSRASLEE